MIDNKNALYGETISTDVDGLSLYVNDGIVTVELTVARVNKLGEPFMRALQAGVERAVAHEGVRGLILASGHRDFCVGADLDALFSETDPAKVFEQVTLVNAVYRRIETAGVPVVAMIAGTALGGGYELALTAHHRIALDDARILIGLPEVSLGVIPGAGGTQRLPYLIGLQAALEHIGAGQPVRIPKAKKIGMVDALASDVASMYAASVQWIEENPKPTQPWDQKKPTWPGGTRPNTPGAMQLFVGASAFIIKKTAGAYPSAEGALRAIADGTRLSFDRGIEVESRIFAGLATSRQAKDMMGTLWFHKNAVDKRGVGCDAGISKVTILGAGMMGAGLGFVSAKAGYEVVIKDISQPALDVAVKHVNAQLAKMRHLSTESREELASRITYTLDYDAVRGSDLVIEAVVENVGVKHHVIREVEPLLSENGIFASNTSAIPITLLSEAAENKARFIGLHFFSPVEKMPLLEVIKPESCSDETLSRCLAFGKAIKKSNIVVNDGYGFFTTRLFAAYLLEGVQLVAEGHDAALVEYAARTAGMVMPPLKVFDEVTLTLGMHGFDVRREVTGEALDMSGLRLVEALVAQGRKGKLHGGGFYDPKTKAIWSGLKDLIHAEPPAETGLEHLRRRLMVAQAAEVGRVLEDGIIRDPMDVDVGAILGLGFAPNTGGPLRWIDSQGVRNLVVEMRTMAARYGERYAPSPFLVSMAERNTSFWE